MDLVVTSGILARLNIEIDHPCLLRVRILQNIDLLRGINEEDEDGYNTLNYPVKRDMQAKEYNLPYIAKIRGSLDKSPGMKMGKKRDGADDTTLPLSEIQYKQILGEVLYSTDRLKPKSSLSLSEQKITQSSKTHQQSLSQTTPFNLDDVPFRFFCFCFCFLVDIIF
jgi:hypothetical protein